MSEVEPGGARYQEDDVYVCVPHRTHAARRLCVRRACDASMWCVTNMLKLWKLCVVGGMKDYVDCASSVLRLCAEVDVVLFMSSRRTMVA